MDQGKETVVKNGAGNRAEGDDLKVLPKRRRKKNGESGSLQRSGLPEGGYKQGETRNKNIDFYGAAIS